jgi:hypothetical protein
MIATPLFASLFNLPFSNFAYAHGHGIGELMITTPLSGFSSPANPVTFRDIE